MDSATLNRIFEPFFTTKEPGKGTGMGLATVYGVLKQHEDWVEVDSAPHRGTTIRAYLPVSRRRRHNHIEKITSQDGRLHEARSTSEDDITILLVEDEDMLREFVSTALLSLGYRVLSAGNGREALEVSAQVSTTRSIFCSPTWSCLNPSAAAISPTNSLSISPTSKSFSPAATVPS